MDAGSRLKEERERLGFSQSDFGLRGGVTRTAQGNYEAGKRSPDLQYLSAISEAGADVLYIVTGVRREESLVSRVARRARGNPLMGARDEGRAFLHAAEIDRRQQIGLPVDEGRPAIDFDFARAAVIAAAKAAGFPPESDVDFVATMMARLIAGEMSEEAVTDAFRFYSLGKKPKGE